MKEFHKGDVGDLSVDNRGLAKEGHAQSEHNPTEIESSPSHLIGVADLYGLFGTVHFLPCSCECDCGSTSTVGEPISTCQRINGVSRFEWESTLRQAICFGNSTRVGKARIGASGQGRSAQAIDYRHVIFHSQPEPSHSSQKHGQLSICRESTCRPL